MQEKTTQEKAAAERQIELLATAFEQAKENGGVWLNPDGKRAPLLHRKEIGISGFNALVLGLHSDRNKYDTNLYTFYSDARKLNSPVRGNERGVPFNWYNWSKYVNRNNPDDTISRNDYLKLPLDDQKQYKGMRQREVRWMFNVQQTILPMAEPDRYERLKAIYGSKEARKSPDDAENADLHNEVSEFLKKMRANLVDIRRDGSALSFYDPSKNIVHLADRETFADYPQFVQEMMRMVAAATGHQQRLARDGVFAKEGASNEDAVMQEKLVEELASGVKMQELGLPAKLSKEGMDMVDYWVRELRENPKLIDIVERDVNKALDVMRKAQNEKVEMASKVNARQTEKYMGEVPKHYYISNEIDKHPDKDTKMAVIVRDKAAKVAEVILPAGASLERNNEVPGMSKDRFRKALEKQGFDTVKFFNVGGSLGYRHDDAYFSGKEVSVEKLKNWDLQVFSQLDVSKAVAQSGQMEFDRVQMVQDDNKRWALFVKSEGREAFSVYPDKSDINRFFTTLKQSQTAIEDVRQELANKYYAMVGAKPELKVDLFGKGQTAEVDLNRIQKVSLFKSKNDVILCAATIEGAGKLEPKVITPQQWQRMWLADNKDEYKKGLAAKLWADVLTQTRNNEVTKGNHAEENAATEKPNAEDKPKEEKQETAKVRGNQETKSVVEQKGNGKKGEEKKSDEKKPEVPSVLAQFHKLKKKHPDALLLFRAGDFYETYKEDAEKASKVLGITLTKNPKTKDDKGKPLALAGFPHHALDTYLPKLIRAGLRVAICDQIVQPKQTAKTGVREMVTPGSVERPSAAKVSEQSNEEKPSSSQQPENKDEQSHGLKR